MSLTSSMWTSITGLLVHGEKMNIIGNNISNANTIGFKGDRMDFMDYLSQEVGTPGGIAQMGRGTAVGAIMKNWKDGAIENTTTTTDLAIAGNGLFKVIPKNSNVEYYTRAGNFRFDKDGYLADPHGYVLQGWRIDNAARSLAGSSGASSSTGSAFLGTGTPTDIRLDNFYCDPKHTTRATMAINLDSAKGKNDFSTDPDNPFFALLQSWNATPDDLGRITPLGKESFAHQQTIEVFDEGGQSHKLSIYFDRVTQTSATNIDDMNQSDIMWEFVVTMDPADDRRNFSSDPADLLPDKYKGLLMSGTLTFDNSGQMRDMNAYVPTTNDMGDMSTWVPAPISANGFPMLTPNFSGRDNASAPFDMGKTPPEVNPQTKGFHIELDLGLRSRSDSWSSSLPATIADWTKPVTSGSFDTIYRVERDSSRKPQFYQKSTTPPADYPAGLGIAGHTIPAWGAPNDSPKAPGEVVEADGNISIQKAASQKLAKGEARGEVGTEAYKWVYEHANGTEGTHTGLVYYDQADPTKKYVFDESTGKYYLMGGTPGDPGYEVSPEDMETAGTKLQPSADMSKPVSSGNPALSNMPKFILDNDGNPIQATITRPYEGMGKNAEKQSVSSTSTSNNTGGNNFYERFRAQDGYTFGELRYVTVSEDGIMSASYSNGETLQLFQVALHDFPSKQNLRREGGNLFTETKESGLPTTGAAGSGPFGTTMSNAIEQSNVDLAQEFVYMITTQKGFQANSKTITTVDAMLDTVIQMKR